MGLLDQILGGLGGAGGLPGGGGGMLGGGGLGIPGGSTAPGGHGGMQRMLVQAAIALLVAQAAKGALGGRGAANAGPGAGPHGGGLADVLGGLLGGAGSSGAGGGLGAVLGGLAGGGGPGGALGGSGGGRPGGLGGLGGLGAVLGGAGALGPLLDAFGQHGRGDAAASWVSTGQNQPIAPDDVERVFGADAVASIAQQLGLSREQAAAGVAQALPEIVDHLTPDGQVPSAERQYASLEDLARRIGPR